ncbi:glycosyltransferase [Caloramator sp. Dgby_cultured_2]|nr:glycosyltransferase [Caloramator sp. Dgby_cultured_2]WDU84535.1 glycosyltransferase [Caloramator sp. Dgby_cultured_2]
MCRGRTEERRINKKAQEKNLKNIMFFPYKKGKEYNEVLCSADCLIISLDKRVVGLGVPSKTYTYLASGRPIIAIIPSNTDIAKDIEKYNLGFVISDYDVKTLKDNILKLYIDKNMRKLMGENSRKLFEQQYEKI